MAKYVVEFSPPQKNKSEPDDVTDSVINYRMTLAPFQKPTQVEFNNIKLKEIAVRFLTFVNPLNKPGQFVIPPPSDGIHFDVYEFTLESNSQCKISITWQPSEYGNMRKLIKVEQVNSKRKYDFVILGNCNGPPYKKFKSATSTYSKSNNENLIVKHSVTEKNEITSLIENPTIDTKPISAKIESPSIRRQTYLIREKENFPNQKKNALTRDTILSSPERSLKRPDQKRQDYVFNNHFSFKNLNKSSSPMSDDSIEFPLKKAVSYINHSNDFRLTPLKSTENLLSPFCIDKKQLSVFDGTDGSFTLSNSPLLKSENDLSADITDDNTLVSSPNNSKPNAWSDVVDPQFRTSPESKQSSNFGQNYKRITTTPVYHCTITCSGTKLKRPSFVIKNSHYKHSPITSVMSKTKQKQCSTSPQTLQLRTLQLDKCDQHLKTLTVPELFYHNNVEDPFIKMSQYYEEEWLNRQESDMIRWLNALLTPTDKLVDKEQSDELEKAAMAWIEASKTSHKNKPMQFATQKDLFAAQIYRQSPQQWSALRKATTNLITSTNVSSVLSKLTISIEKDLISIRDDRQIHLDLCLKKKIFDLLKCYNPLWIRIGLEAIFGQTICVKAGSNDLDGIGWFVRKNLFNNDYVKQKFTKTNVIQVNLPSYNMAMNKFILRKIMMLIYFLDRAKEHQLIRHNPCLFKTDSPYKSSHDLLIGFCADMVTAHGDIVRRLRSMGYCLTHKQTHLDEVNYAVKSLNDLRDGTRITKAVEILFKGLPLSQKLRLPAISKLQKIHNVNLAINRISQHISIEGNISTRDIVSGHREKILSLFWQIIYKYLTPRYNNAAVKIQNWWRNSSLKLVILKRIRAKQIAKRHLAAAKIQAHVRGYLIRKHWPRLRVELVENREMLHVSATRIKHYLKRKLKLLTEDRKRYIILRRTVVFVQRKFRNKMAMVRERRKYLETKRSAVIIQKVFRGFVVRKNWPRIANVMAAEKNKRIAAVNTIKRALRRNLPPTRDRLEFLKLKRAVANVRRRYVANRLMKSEMERYSALKCSTVLVQRKFRANIAMRKERETYLNVQRSVILIQKTFRGFSARKRWPDTRNRLWFEKRKRSDAANVIKQALRRNLPPTRDRLEFLKLKRAVTNVQRRYVANRLMKSEMERYAALKSITVIVQRKFRANVTMRKTQGTYLKVKRSIRLIQKVYRGFAVRKRWPDIRNHLLSEKQKRTNAAKVIKRALRRNLPPTRDRLEFLKLKRAVMNVQRRYVANRLMKSEIERYAALKCSTILVQRKFRANIAMQKERETYLNLHRSVILIQRTFRGFSVRKRWPDTRNRLLSEKQKRTNAANVIKRALRRNLPPTRDRLEFLKLKRVVMNVQRRYVANRLMKSEMESYAALKCSTVLVQRKFRANVAMRKERVTYLKVQLSVLSIQKFFRGFAARKRWPDTQNRLSSEKQKRTNAANVIERALRRNLPPTRDRLEFLKLKRAVTNVQRRYVANRLMKSEMERYSALKCSTVLVQRKFRANIAMRKERETYLNVQRSVILIQKTFRGFSARKRWPDTRNRLWFEKRKRSDAANVIKRAFRRNLPESKDRSLFVKLKRAVVVVQRTWRANKLMRDQRDLYTSWQRATVFVQRTWRAQLQIRMTRREYLKTEQVAIVLQKAFRGFVTRKQWPALRDRLAAEKTKRVQAANTIKRFLRKNLPPTRDAVLYSQLKRSVVAVQRRYRANLAMRSQRESFLVLKYNVIILQQRFRANQAMAVERNLYVKLRTAVVCVQRRFRANAKAKLQRAVYNRIRWAAIVLQTRFRARRVTRAAVTLQAHVRGFLARRRWLQMDADRKLAANILQERNNAASKIQAVVRGFLARKKLSALKDQQKIEKVTNAAISIQTLWRGYRVRKKYQCRQETQWLPKKDTLTIAKQHNNVLVYMVKQKSNEFSYQELSTNLWKLDLYTSLSYVLCATTAQGYMVDYIFRFLQYSNQSQPSIEARIPAVLVLTNLLKCHDTSKLIWGKTIAADINKLMIKIMKSSCGKFGSANDLYCSIATWFWIALQDAERKLYIKKIPNINLDMKTMLDILNRKYKTRQMDKKTIVLPTKRLTCSIGVKCQKRFISDLYATIQICKTLNIK